MINDDELFIIIDHLAMRKEQQNFVCTSPYLFGVKQISYMNKLLVSFVNFQTKWRKCKV